MPVPPPPPEPAFATGSARATVDEDAVAAPHAAVSLSAFAQSDELDPNTSGALLKTRAAGLLFLWTLMQHLGLAEWDAAHPDAWMAPQVLRLALQRLRVPHDDPAWAMLDSLHAAHLAVAAPDGEPDCEEWLRRCRRYARRRCGIGLASLVLRPGWLHWSETHIDLHFRLVDADLRVRRAGLDTDPGWVNALQRVVGFHFHHEAPWDPNDARTP